MGRGPGGGGQGWVGLGWMWAWQGHARGRAEGVAYRLGVALPLVGSGLSEGVAE